jgi:hypothetical protein
MAHEEQCPAGRNACREPPNDLLDRAGDVDVDVEADDEVVLVPRRRQVARSASSQAIRSATSGPMASAVDRAYAMAVGAKSTAVTRHPRAASQSASEPWPQPASRARPGGRPATSAVRYAFGGRSATRSPCSRRACDQRSSQEFRSHSPMFCERYIEEPPPRFGPDVTRQAEAREASDRSARFRRSAGVREKGS